MAFPDIHKLGGRARNAVGERLSWRAAMVLIICLSLLGWGAVAAALVLLLG
ncbi:MAG TPA: hypothetical protein VMF86_05855 [Stellaceae bacterium]|nr:hypothetical protein [Stellaceae bacterium]